MIPKRQLDIFADRKPPKAIVPHNHTPTSIEAAVSVCDHVGRLEGVVLACIKAAPDGRTDDEIELLCGLSHQCASARRNGLMHKALIRDSGEKRPTRSGRRAVIWKVT